MNETKEANKTEFSQELKARIDKVFDGLSLNIKIDKESFNESQIKAYEKGGFETYKSSFSSGIAEANIKHIENLLNYGMPGNKIKELLDIKNRDIHEFADEMKSQIKKSKHEAVDFNDKYKILSYFPQDKVEDIVGILEKQNMFRTNENASFIINNFIKEAFSAGNQTSEALAFTHGRNEMWMLEAMDYHYYNSQMAEKLLDMKIKYDDVLKLSNVDINEFKSIIYKKGLPGEEQYFNISDLTKTYENTSYPEDRKNPIEMLKEKMSEWINKFFGQKNIGIALEQIYNEAYTNGYNKGKEKGYPEGLKKGKELGRAEEKQDVFKRLVHKNVPHEKIKYLLNLNGENYDKLFSEIKAKQGQNKNIDKNNDTMKNQASTNFDFKFSHSSEQNQNYTMKR